MEPDLGDIAAAPESERNHPLAQAFFSRPEEARSGVPEPVVGLPEPKPHKPPVTFHP